jgi:acetyl esterase/lipase
MKPMIEAQVGGPAAGVVEADHDVPTRDGSSIVVRSYIPDQAPPKGSPLIVMYHGGGFCIGDLLTLTPLCRILAMKLGAVVLNVAYRLAPEHQFPIPVYDSWDALQWVGLDVRNVFRKLY